MNSPALAAATPEIYVNGVRLLSARDIAREHGYVRDYISRLCRQGKVSGRQLGRLWYVDASSFDEFLRQRARSAAETAQPAV